MKFGEIAFLANSAEVKLLDTGYSEDEKWQIDGRYLLRLYSKSNKETIEWQADLIRRANEFGCAVPKVWDVGMWSGKPYMILDYVKGEDAEYIMDQLNDIEQFKLGLSVGAAIRKLHSVPVEQPETSWKQRWSARVARLAPKYREIFKDSIRHMAVLDIIEQECSLMEGRPVAIQHYDLHPANIIVKDGSLAGIIDLQKVTLADPYHEFYKMEYFTTPISAAYARGMIEGYGVNDDFWRLHRLYAAIHIMSAEVWVHTTATSQQQKFQEHTARTLEEWDGFEREIPRWYADEK